MAQIGYEIRKSTWNQIFSDPFRASFICGNKSDINRISATEVRTIVCGDELQAATLAKDRRTLKRVSIQNKKGYGAVVTHSHSLMVPPEL